MNVLAQSKRPQIYLVGAPTRRPSNDVFDYSATSLDRSFEGWLKAVAEIGEATQGVSNLLAQDSSGVEPIVQLRSLELCPPVTKKTQLQAVTTNKAQLPAAIRVPVKQTLTTQDFVKVMMVTLRESFIHRRWPIDTVTKFLGAEVIARRSRGQ